MAAIGEVVSLPVVREKSIGVWLDGGALGEVLLPRKEVPEDAVIGSRVSVFLYTDSEDRPIATTTRPRVLPGHFGKLKCVEVNRVGAFLDWGLAKDLLVPFAEQRTRMTAGKSYVVHVHVDESSGRIIATPRVSRHLDRMAHRFHPGDKVDLIVFAKTDLGYKTIVNEAFTGLLFHDRVFRPLTLGERLDGWITDSRPDGKLDVSLQAPGRSHLVTLEEEILAELKARGGFWAIGDFSPAQEIHDELGVSKRAFKQALGALLKKKTVAISDTGIRTVP